MAFPGLRRTRRKSSAAVAALGAGAALAGGALVWLLDPQGGGGKARELTSAMTERAKALSGEARARLGHLRAELRSRLDAQAPQARRRAMAGLSGAVLVARGVLGGGLLGGPSRLLGASVIARVASETEAVKRGVRRATELVRQTTERLREAREQREAAVDRAAASQDAARGSGARRTPAGREAANEPSAAARTSGSTRTPEVQEVKSPTELEPGIASASPDPVVPGRVDRSGPHMRGDRGVGTARRASEPIGEPEEILSTPTTDDVAPSAFDAPPPGAAVRDAELGVVVPREGAAGSEGEQTGTAAPRIAGAGEEPGPERKAASDADAARMDPTSDGG